MSTPGTGAIVACFASAVLAACLTLAIADGRRPADPLPDPTPTQAELLEAAVSGCVAGGGTSWTGVDESGLVVHRCRPWLDLGISTVSRRAR